MPPIVIATGLSIHTLSERYTGAAKRWIAHAAPFLLVVLVGARELKFYRLPVDDWSRLKYGEIYISVKRMGEEIGQNLLPQETFYEIGYDPGLYYYSRRIPPTGMLFADDWESGSAAEGFMQRIIGDLTVTRPELFITTGFWMASERNRQRPVAQWCLAHYRPFPRGAQHGPFLLYALRGGHLESRLKARP
jgi:hypothetical protein